MSKLSEELRTMARRAGLCDEWFGEWEDDCAEDELIGKYKRGIDFSLIHDWLPNSYIRRKFSEEVLARNGVYVDMRGYISGNGVYVINGDSDVEGSFGDFSAATIYVRHHSRLFLDVSGFARVAVRVFDDAHVDITSKDNAQVVVYRYSNARVITEGNVVLRDKCNIYAEK